MQYKNRLLELVRLQLSAKHSQSEIDKMIGNWNDSSYKDKRNAIIEDSLKNIRQCILKDYMRNLPVPQLNAEDDGLNKNGE